ncbi:MAG: glutamine-hydrolyzing GMP synthase subunit GuaA [Thermoplasmata archaeon]|nr:MAG: glutamine-hydrolyzing GMP synthase subunit GuaA [Thermoplasmata archaeon]RLF41474.1 MAG: glutamine-hydrolyzing GMP synthase subunit GuaA [Thermoplasmata archaeon]HDN50514.1 glutamine-hydrolyzing GMP synthase subunit GuaA [Thermoplasmatales archaeon]
MFDAASFVEKAVDDVKKQVKGKAVIAVSGGVDSTVAAKIGSMALGENLVAVYVDTGLMRKGESEFVNRLYGGMPLRFILVDAKEEFLDALRGVVDPEEKRKIIGEKFIRIFERVAREENASYLIQGTIAPDWIESGGELRDTIKSHHNVGGLPTDMALTVVEPLRHIYKDEVREVARYLKLAVAERQPFPGPGLAVRILEEIDEEKVDIVRRACAVVEEEIDAAWKSGMIEKPWQYFAVLLPVRSVGVRGDVRAYGYTIAIRSVDSVDAMTAVYSKLPHELLEKMATRITNEIREVNRVVYDISDKPPATIEWE